MFYRRYGKRLFDLLAASIGLVLLSPVFLISALLIAVTSKGPVFYTQRRVGREGRPFDVVKFRTMVVGAERLGTGVLVIKDDPRITRVGRFLRAWSIDELPQLFNVLTGSMSVIGPRPGLPYQAEQYDAHQRRRLEVAPGISGWAQVNGRNSIPWDRRIRLDIEYVDRLSLWLDVRIVIKTILIILRREQQLAAGEFFTPPAPGASTSEPPSEPPPPNSMHAGSSV